MSFVSVRQTSLQERSRFDKGLLYYLFPFGSFFIENSLDDIFGKDCSSRIRLKELSDWGTLNQMINRMKGSG